MPAEEPAPTRVYHPSIAGSGAVFAGTIQRLGREQKWRAVKPMRNGEAGAVREGSYGVLLRWLIS